MGQKVKEDKISKAENALKELQKSSLQRFNSQVETIKTLIADPAERVLKLQALKDDIDATGKFIWSQNQGIKLDRASKKAWKIAGIVTAIATAAVVAPIIALGAPPVYLLFLMLPPVLGAATKGLSELTISFHHFLDTTPEMNKYFKEADAQKSYADKMLGDVIKNTSIDKMSNSLQFDAAYKKCEQLRDHFTAEAAKKAAQKGQPPVIQAKPSQQRAAPAFM